MYEIDNHWKNNEIYTKVEYVCCDKSKQAKTQTPRFNWK